MIRYVACRVGFYLHAGARREMGSTSKWRSLMLIVAINPGHDGAMAVLDDRKLLFSVESEKDSYPRHHSLHPDHVLGVLEQVPGPPDVIAYGGWGKPGRHVLGHTNIGTGYAPVGVPDVALRPANFLGRPVQLFASSHERSHIMMAVGMAPGPLDHDAPARAVLVWEGMLGRFSICSTETWSVTQTFPVLTQPGTRYAFLFALANPDFTDQGGVECPRGCRQADGAGRLRRRGDADAGSSGPLTNNERRHIWRPRRIFRDSPVYNAGVEAERDEDAAALLTERIFEIFADAAREAAGRHPAVHLRRLWAELRLEHQVARARALLVGLRAALHERLRLGARHGHRRAAPLTGDPHIEWDVYSGLEFEWDPEPDPARGSGARSTTTALADALAGGRVVAWVQGRWEIGPRALGNRSLLAEPFDARTRDRLNEIKQREDYRPIAPAAASRMPASCSTRTSRTRTCSISDGPVRGARRGHPRGRVCAGADRLAGDQQAAPRAAVGVRGAHGVGVLCNTS